MGECQVILLCNVLKKIVQKGGHHKKTFKDQTRIEIVLYISYLMIIKFQKEKLDPTNRQ